MREILKREQYSAKDAESLLFLAKQFVDGIEKIDYMVIAIAGVVHDHAKVKITNIKHWPEVVADEFKHELNIPHVIILNDFEANGYGVQIIGKDDYIEITENKPVKYGNIGVVGAGTGLGEAYLSHKHGTEFYNVHPCEGGHTEFCAMTLLDFEF